MSKMFMNVKEVMEVLEVSESYAYKLMKRLNRELQAMGCQTIAGKVDRAIRLSRDFWQLVQTVPEYWSLMTGNSRLLCWIFGWRKLLSRQKPVWWY